MATSGPKRKSKAAQTRRGDPGKRAAPAKPRKKPAVKKAAKKPAAKARRQQPLAPPAAAAAVAASPEPPDWLGRQAQAHWRRTAPVIAKRGLFTELDRDALAIYCDAWQQLYDADQAIECHGEWITSEKGYVYAHPAVAKRNKAIDRIRKVGEQLGLTPNSRRGLEMDSADADPLAEFLSHKPI